MVVSSQSGVSILRDAWVEIDLAALERNVKVAKSWLKPETQLMAVVKSDAYGHGAAAVSPVLVAAGANCLGVASVDEGCQLRSEGIRVPIVILSPCPSWALKIALESELDFTVTSLSQVKDVALAASKYQRHARVHLKVDTGMHRLGVPPEKASELAAAIKGESWLDFAGVSSHLAVADDEAACTRQNTIFKRVIEQLQSSGTRPRFAHLASSDAARRFPQLHYDMVRIGLLLYGLEPRTVSDVVTPVMSVRARINHLQDVPEGEAVGYGWTWTAQRASRLASVPIGYADGIDRGLSNRLPGLLLGRIVPQVGLISMDQMLIDVTDVPQAQDGDVITFVGKELGGAPANAADNILHLASWATMLDTITYELACRLRVRLPRVYTRHV